MGVVKEWRGRGVGGRLLTALVAAARDQHMEALSLSVEADNYSRRLYERVGFRRVGIVGGPSRCSCVCDVSIAHDPCSGDALEDPDKFVTTVGRQLRDNAQVNASRR